jgi:hypothetical protein
MPGGAIGRDGLDACSPLMVRPMFSLDSRRGGRAPCRAPGTPAARHAASMEGPKKGLGRLKAYKHLPVLKAVLAAHAGKHALSKNIERQANAA